MATKILDLNVAEIPAQINDLAEYDQAYIIFRLHGRPLGTVWTPIINDYLTEAEIIAAIAKTGEWPLWNAWLYDYLEIESVRPDQTPPSQPATIAICTRDRTDDLRRCLSALQRLPDDGQEILVIDNCPSTDDTLRLVKSYPHIRYIREDRPGLNVARNRALREARHGIVAFNDDDAVPEPGWLRALLYHFADKRVLAVTGLTLPLELETTAQEWFERRSPFQRGFQSKTYHLFCWPPLFAGRVGAGANMALRRSVVDAVGPFDEALDAGTPTHSGGDTEMFSRILVSGHHIVYEPTAVSWHRHRRTWDALQQALYGYGVGTYALWTRQFLFDRELTIPYLAWSWFGNDQLPELVKSLLKRPDSIPLTLLLAELKGCLVGPFAYFASRRQLRRHSPTREVAHA